MNKETEGMIVGIAKFAMFALYYWYAFALARRFGFFFPFDLIIGGIVALVVWKIVLRVLIFIGDIIWSDDRGK